jgi:GNAT superfamily N-acetyltransferase
MVDDIQIEILDTTKRAGVPMATFQIRYAEEHRDWRALRMLLPEAIHQGCGCDAFVATDDAASQRVIGAVAMAPLMRVKPLPGPKIALHVIEPWRRRGVARALRNVISNVAAARGAKALYAWTHLSPDSAEAQAWRAMQFDEVIDCPLNRIDATRTIEMLQPIYDWLKKRGRIPADAHLVFLRDAKPDDVLNLVTTHLGGAGDRATLKKRLLGKHPVPFDPVLSRILMHRETIVGAILGRPVEGDAVVVEVNVVHPSVRGRWANAWLKLDATSRARDLGFSTFFYETYQQHADTAKLTRRLGGVLVPRIELYHVIASQHR